MFRIINKLKNRKGFTLIELIVVLAVLVVIAAIAVPRFMGVQEKAKEDADESTLSMVAKAAELYFAQNDAKSKASISDLDISDVEFQSDKYDKYSESALEITKKDDGSVEIKSTSGSGVELYPIHP